MDTAPTISSSPPDATRRRRSAVQVATIGALVATVVNVALWAGGRAADVGFLVSPAVGEPFQVGVVLVIMTTLVVFAVGSAALALAARRSRQWVRVVIAAAAVVAVVSAGGPLSAAQDTATGALLAAMHLATGATFVATAARVSTQDIETTS